MVYIVECVHKGIPKGMKVGKRVVVVSHDDSGGWYGFFSQGVVVV
jgi:hypothetical protein